MTRTNETKGSEAEPIPRAMMISTDSPVTPKQVLRTAEVAELIERSRSYVRKAVADGRLVPLGFSRTGWFSFDRREVERFVADEART
jgi:hypothetical protein